MLNLSSYIYLLPLDGAVLLIKSCLFKKGGRSKIPKRRALWDTKVREVYSGANFKSAKSSVHL